MIVQTTPYGGVRENFRTDASTPEIIDWAMKGKEDWLCSKEHLLPHYPRMD